MSSNTTIAKNTIALYLRMFLTMIVGLYTSRVVLATLGVEDYGVYGIVGGVVGMMGFLNSAMSGATSRFLTYELGRGDKERLEKTFSSALIVHIIIALLVFVVAETVGLWYVCNKLVIPEGRLTAAICVYQFSILSSMLSITQVPYNSSIIAHEKMDVYAYVEILNVTLKLLIVYLLVIGDFDKLILYAILTFVVSIIVRIVYRIYCLKNFKECHFHFVWNKSYIKPLLSFSGWNLFGNFGGIMGNQGMNLVINSFFGVVMNASASIALTVSGIVTQFASNAMTAFRPPITKLYAQGDVPGMQSLTLLALKVIMLLYTIVAIPVFAELDYVLSLWLVEVPIMASLFCRILLVSIFFETMRYIIIIDIHASGNVKLVSALTGTLMCLSPAILYILYKLGFPVQSSFIVIASINCVLLMSNVLIAKHYIPTVDIFKYYSTIAIIVVSTVVSLFITLYIKCLMSESFLTLCAIVIISAIIQLMLFITLSLNSTQRNSVLSFVITKLRKQNG